jgi:hypothetical protein
MATDQFYVTLPSNASMKTYPTNSVSDYKTLLPNRVELTGNYEVGLVDFSYPVSWHNVGPNEFFQIKIYSLLRPTVDLKGPLDELSFADVGEGPMAVSEGHYESGEALFEHMLRVWNDYWNEKRNELYESGDSIRSNSEKIVVPSGTYLTYRQRASMKRADEHIVPSLDQNSLYMHYNDKTNKMTFHLKHKTHTLLLSPKLTDILAIHRGASNIYVSETEVDVNRASHTFFIYCDLVADSTVGDVTAPLLRTTVATGKYGENVKEIFNRPMYLPLKTNNFDTIEISIKTETGDNVPFTFGNSLVTLHFRRVGKQLAI